MIMIHCIPDRRRGVSPEGFPMKKEKIIFMDVKEMPFLCISVDDMQWNRTGSWRYIRPRYVDQIPPCNSGCPGNEDIEGWLELISKSKYREAYELIRMENPFPSITGRVCFHPCEGKCNRKEFGGAISINMLEQFIADMNADSRPAEPVITGAGFNAAVVGSGPAGLSCAYHLKRLGHKVTVFEKQKYAGGMLRYGIPSYRLPKNILDREIELLKGMGINFITSTQKDLSELKQEFDRLFIAFGAQSSRKMGAENEEGQGAMSGLSYLSKILSGEKVETGKNILVIGGGNTAIDSARAALRSGSENVKILYRRTRVEMPASQEEITQAEEEGVKIELLTAPVKVLRDESGNAKALVCIKMRLGEPDASGRARPIPVENSDFEIPCDMILSAIGEEVDFGKMPASVGIKSGLAAVDQNLCTTDHRIFAGGDMIDQPRTVIDAVASGKKAAIAIDCEFRGRKLADIQEILKGASPRSVSMIKYAEFLKNEQSSKVEKDHIVEFKELNLNYFTEKNRLPRPELSVEKRFESDPETKEFCEVHKRIEKGYSQEESDRCFHCGRCIECDNCFVFCPDVSIKPAEKGFYEINYDFCKGCGVCVHECPRLAMEMIPEPAEE
jgi:2-oxoacid:acceptor oxidoreductase delta subunit (pyruvate/2-ketoisovalerate family)